MKALIVALAVLTAPTDSLPDLSHPWTLAECTSWALEHNLSLATQELNEEYSRIEKNTADMSWLPGVSGSVSQNWSFGRGIGGNNTYESGNSASTGFSVGANMTLFDGLATPRRMQLAKLNLEAATADLEKARNDIRVQVAQAYVQVLYNYEIADVAREQLAIDSLQVARLEGLYEAGRSSAAELSQQKATFAQSQVTLVEAESNVRTSLLTLAQLLEVAPWESFSIVRPEVSLDDIYIADPDAVYADAIDIRPEIQAEKLRLDGALKQVQIAQASYYPSLSLSAGLGTNYYSSFGTQGFWDQLSNNFSQYVGLSLNIPIFNRFSTRNQVRSARLQQSAQEVQMKIAGNTLYKEIQQAWNSAVAARAKWESSQTAADAARDAFQLTQSKYENGKATITEFNEARARYIKAQSDSVQATYQYLYQARLVDFYRGGQLVL